MLIAGVRGPPSDCNSLGPHLYLFVPEAFFAFLQEASNRLRGLPIPNAFEDILLSEYADDTILFLYNDAKNLQQSEQLVEDFCQVFGAKVNWDKTKGLWISMQEKPRWQPHIDFKRVPVRMTFK